MPLKLRNATIIQAPTDDNDVVEVLGLKIPRRGKLPYGGQTLLMEASLLFTASTIREYQFFNMAFCAFTWRLPKRERVDHEWLIEQTLTVEESTEIIRAVNELLPLHEVFERVDEGKAEEEPEAETPKKTKT